LRFGVGNDFPRGRQADYVLSNFTDEDQKTLDQRMEMGIKIVHAFTTNGIDRTMSDFNGK
jgi:PTH1 family peptidyl-tRNA hydrolase